MADLFRRDYYTGQEEMAKAEFGRTLFSLGSSLLSETIQKKEAEEYSTAIGKFIEEAEDYTKWQRENADKPDLFVGEIDNRRDKILTSILNDVRTPGARARITDKFNRDFAVMRAGAEETAYNQARTNEQVSFENTYNKIIDIPADKDLSQNETQNLIDQLIHLTDSHARGKSPQEVQGLEQLEKQGFEQIVSTHILQNATSIEDIDKANEIAHEFGLDSIFNAGEIDDLKVEYNRRIRNKQADIKALQDAKENELLTGILNGEIDNRNIITSALWNNQIDAAAARRLINDLDSGVETDDAANMEIEDAILDFGSGRKDREELDEIFKNNRNKISKDDKSSLMKKLSSEGDKYLDNQTRTGHKIISNILFSSMGASVFDEVTGEVNWGQLISSGKATAEEIAAYRKGSMLFNAWLDKQLEKKIPQEEDVIYQALKIGNQIKKEVASGKIMPTLKSGKAGTPAIVDPSQKPIGTYDDDENIVLNEYGFEWLITWTGSRDPNVLRKFASDHNMVIPE